uniref:Gonadotropin-releasing hormone receptor 4 n=1 Tax=Ciona intestinalis TaxID=7719 RepID=Q3ZK33_CIOIN|nr:gonadotropin-releasing hormone receptor 4 [Ciona intestinalis]
MMTSPTMTSNITGCNVTSTYSPEFIIENQYDCDAMFESFLSSQRLVFDSYHLTRIWVTWVIFFISLAGNLTVLISVTVLRKTQSYSHCQLIMTHLSLANLAFTLFVLPMDAIWNYTLEWLAGDVMCRIMNSLKQFAMYISSAMIMVMGVDRVTGLLRPVSANQQRRRIVKFLTVAWVFSFINSIPPSVMFSAGPYWPMRCECPNHYVVQCVDFHLIKKGREIFYIYSMFISFFIPLYCIIICYLIIAFSIAKMAKRAKATELQSSGFRPPSSRKSLARRSLQRAKKISQLVTGLITITFVICWGPYYVVGLMHWFNEQHIERLPEGIMLMSLYLNPCLHPFITVCLMKEIRESICRKPNCSLATPR